MKAVDADTEIRGGKEEPWYWHTKQKKMMKAEVADAFKIRKWVLIALAAACIGVGFGILVLWRLVFSIWQSWGRNDLEGFPYFTVGTENVGNRLGRDW